jgi:hypothetical protein
MPTDYVKCYTTSVEPEESQGHIIATLHRYGASGFGFRRRGPIIEITFHMPVAGGEDRTVCIPINVETVRAKLRPKLEAFGKRRKTAGSTRIDPMQAERVAWRILLDWIDASLSAVTIGAQTLEEAFFAHLLVETTDGQTGRTIDYVTVLSETSGQSNGHGRKLPGLGRSLDRTLLLGAGSAEGE